MLGRMADFGKLQGFFMLFQVIGGFLGTLITGAVDGHHDQKGCVLFHEFVKREVHFVDTK